MAGIIIAANDKIDTPIPGLLAELTPLKAMKGVKRFEVEFQGNGNFEIYLIGSKYKASSYTIANKAKWLKPKQGTKGPGLRDHYQKHGWEIGALSSKEYDASARRTIQNGRKFSYRDKLSGEIRTGYWDEKTGLFTATSQTRKIPAIMTHYPLSWDEIRRFKSFSLIK